MRLPTPLRSLWQRLQPRHSSLEPEPGNPVRTTDLPVTVGQVMATSDLDDAWHVVTAIGRPIQAWDDDLQYHRKSYPYQARAATWEEISAAAGRTAQVDRRRSAFDGGFGVRKR